jgi:hypothetical protein
MYSLNIEHQKSSSKSSSKTSSKEFIELHLQFGFIGNLGFSTTEETIVQLACQFRIGDGFVGGAQSRQFLED